MEVLFIGCIYSQLQIDLFQSKSKRGYQYAAQNFQGALVDGFIKCQDTRLKVLSIPSLSTYPRGCELMTVEDSPFIFDGRELGKSFGFLNLPFANHLHQSRIDKFIDDWYSETEGRKSIVVYAMLKQQMQYAVDAKKRHPDIKLCLVIPDLPMYMACNKYYKALGLQKRDIKTIEVLLQEFDCYVVLAEPMTRQLNITNKPYSVIEGIYTDTCPIADNTNKFSGKNIMYAGGIVSRYGVFDLIEAFHRSKNEDYRLILCGPCPEMEKLNAYLLSDSRIEYRGLIPTADVRKLQRQVTLLVNPRHSTEEFSKYSFPSKTLEYMASGTPVLMSELPSMPEDYKQHIFMFADESVEGMRKEIEKVLSYAEEKLSRKGLQAKSFILEKKNSQHQVKKIIELLDRTIYH